MHCGQGSFEPDSPRLVSLTKGRLLPAHSPPAPAALPPSLPACLPASLLQVFLSRLPLSPIKAQLLATLCVAVVSFFPFIPAWLCGCQRRLFFCGGPPGPAGTNPGSPPACSPCLPPCPHPPAPRPAPPHLLPIARAELCIHALLQPDPRAQQLCAWGTCQCDQLGYHAGACGLAVGGGRAGAWVAN